MSIRARAYAPGVEVRPVATDSIAEAADALTRAMMDDPETAYLIPDPVERLRVHRLLFEDTIERALELGRVDACGDPILGVSIWLRRPAVTDPVDATAAPRRTHDPAALLGPQAMARAERFAAVMRDLREQARPDRHAYLDSLGVLREHRRQGIASRLLDVGHAWADALGLPCALDTLTDENVAFYEGRGYRVVARAPVPGSDLRLTAMRRSRLAAAAAPDREER